MSDCQVLKPQGPFYVSLSMPEKEYLKRRLGIGEEKTFIRSQSNAISITIKRSLLWTEAQAVKLLERLKSLPTWERVEAELVNHHSVTMWKPWEPAHHEAKEKTDAAPGSVDPIPLSVP